MVTPLLANDYFHKMKKAVAPILCFLVLSACGANQNLAQTKSMFSNNDTLIKNINNSKADAETNNAELKKLVQENDLVIAFASLNYAWTRRGTYTVLANRNKEWKLYWFQSRLPPSANESTEELKPLNVSAADAEKIKNLYAESSLWTTEGDADGNFCAGKKDCNINDAETWAISAATPQKMHTTTYYAPKFFEECCPGNSIRARFVGLAEEMMKLTGNRSSAPDR